jgi:restriction endonuclease Mrr
MQDLNNLQAYIHNMKLDQGENTPDEQVYSAADAGIDGIINEDPPSLDTIYCRLNVTPIKPSILTTF